VTDTGLGGEAECGVHEIFAAIGAEHIGAHHALGDQNGIVARVLGAEAAGREPGFGSRRTFSVGTRARRARFGLAIAGVLALAARDATLRDGILITVAAALGGMAFGRLVSGVVDRPKAFFPNWFYFLVEMVAAAALLGAARGH
jgi:hypothetical protein